MRLMSERTRRGLGEALGIPSVLGGVVLVLLLLA
jgi:hypothetical protein